MNHSIKTGIFFGLTSGVITTLGMLVGLNATTQSQAVVLGGILIIAITDSLSDAVGIHVSEESKGNHTEKEVWVSTFSTFFAKLTTSLSFIVPILCLDLSLAVIASIAWGMFLLAAFSFYMAKEQQANVFRVVAEHLLVAVIVIILTNWIGGLINNKFN